jgi:Arc/MetJ-type ribon-helix-helix transcriptional regulator
MEDQRHDQNSEQKQDRRQRRKFSEELDSLVEEINKAVRVAIDRGASTAESLGDNLKETIQGVRSNRDNVVMVRIDKESLGRVDQLVESGIVSSRSEAAAFLISEGIKARKESFERISQKVDEIRRTKEELRRLIDEETDASGRTEHTSY